MFSRQRSRRRCGACEVIARAVVLASVALVLVALGNAAEAGGATDPPGGRYCNRQGDPSLVLPLDNTWSVVSFLGASECDGSAGPGVPCRRNNDDHSPVIPLSFTFDLYGQFITEIRINTNGVLSVGEGFCSMDPYGFPVPGVPLVAPFWADADTRDESNACGTVWAKTGPNYLAVTYDHVGYQNSHTDKLNTFQVVISDGTFVPVGLGNNVCFSYGDMQWTTGDASGGLGGFGGAPAHVGVNRGDGVDYFQIGLFDQPGIVYDGPSGNNDGVDWLDDQVFCFYAGTHFDDPPFPSGFPPGYEIEAAAGDTMLLSVAFIHPDEGASIHTAVDDGDLANFFWVSTDGNPSTVDMTFAPDESQVGSHVIHFTATAAIGTRDFTELDLVIEVVPLTPIERRSWGAIKGLYR